ncbi:hypothetical protein I3842_11G067900 [Carya illinoinensis]|uniref:Uncharacterized protein n=1 Tax=Carya illinoinensis TaxID=32201 RepID=A0A922DMM8_CARIL|nr:hypothetical protein I3842_11G067900 [Carya illinoinensis]
MPSLKLQALPKLKNRPIAQPELQVLPKITIRPIGPWGPNPIRVSTQNTSRRHPSSSPRASASFPRPAPAQLFIPTGFDRKVWPLHGECNLLPAHGLHHRLRRPATITTARSNGHRAITKAT